MNYLTMAMHFTREDIIASLQARGQRQDELARQAHAVRVAAAGEGIFLRGLIEYSNRCHKSCLYCGIRRGRTLNRYTLDYEEVMQAARLALREGFGSVVIQAGEISSARHIALIERIVGDIKALTPRSVGVPDAISRDWDPSLGITLSLGEQTPQTYRRWLSAGATRYLLRIETSNPDLYAAIHPGDGRHTFERRLQALHDLRAEGYMLGTGVMIGLPGQTVEHLADDLLFMRGLGIDMCGMGPYIECAGTPMAGLEAPSLEWRMDTTLNMVATLRLMMPDINIAATTALETIGRGARERALHGGANVMMPNLTPAAAERDYKLYNEKFVSTVSGVSRNDVCFGKQGNPLHFKK